MGIRHGHPAQDNLVSLPPLWPAIAGDLVALGPMLLGLLPAALRLQELAGGWVEVGRCQRNSSKKGIVEDQLVVPASTF